MTRFTSQLLFVWALVIASAGAQAAQPSRLKSFEPDSMQQIVATPRGKPVLVMVWSLDCAYCLENLKIVSAERKRHRNRFDIVTIATDPINDAQMAKLINAKLSSVGLTHDAWSFGDAAPEQLRYAIDPAWRGEVPRTYWFEADGRRSAHSGAISKTLLAEKLALQR